MEDLNFKSFFENSLRNILKPVPQSPRYHAEGDVWAHTRMVRKQLNDAIRHYKSVVSDKSSVFSNLDPELSRDDVNLLRIGAWMHDIGKASATTIDGEPWEPGKSGNKIQAISHENPWHFEPMMQRLTQQWKNMYEKSSSQDKEDLWYIIQHHMDLKSTGFGKKLLSTLLDDNGKFLNERKIRLLLIIIMMDQSGRIDLEDLNSVHLDNISNLMIKSAVDFHNKRNYKPPVVEKPFEPPFYFVRRLKLKGLNDESLQKAFQGKFKRTPTPEELG